MWPLLSLTRLHRIFLIPLKDSRLQYLSLGPSHTGPRLLTLAAVLLGSVGCDGGTGPSTIGTGTLVITAAATGDGPRPLSYGVQVDTLPSDGFGAGQSVRFEIASGDHVVYLSHGALNCIVAGNPQHVSIEAGERKTVMFAVTCDPLPTRPPDIVFEFGYSGTDDLYGIQADGTGLRSLGGGPGLDSDPQWSTNGARIDFRSETGGPGGSAALYSMLPDGSDVQVVKSDLQGDLQTWSPDRSRLLFRWLMPGVDGLAASLYVINSDGTGFARVARPRELNGGPDPYIATPSWSPDGRLAAFGTQGRPQSGGGGTALTYIVEPGVTEPVLIAAGSQPAWSPDGQRLAFVNNAEGLRNANIYIVTIGSVEPAVQVTNPVPIEWRYSNPAWSPDGQWLVATRRPEVGDPDPSPHLVALRTDGSEVRILRRFDASPAVGVPRPTIGRTVWRPNGASP